MQSLPTDVFSVATVREIDRSAIEDNGIPGYTLMTRAGEASVQAARARFPEARRWQVVVGAGNNGGDGYVVARLAAQAGIAVSVLALVPPEKLQGDAARAHADFVAEDGVTLAWHGELDTEAHLLFDGILGSGLERAVGGEYARAVDAINAHSAPVVALDIPTGISGDTGAKLGCAVEADLTVTFVGLKSGLFLQDGPDHCGELVFAGLDIPEDARGNPLPAFRRFGDERLAALLPRRRKSAHKGDFGHVLVVGGGEGMPGAVRLCGEAALRTGAGLVSIATHPAHASSVVIARPELMCHAIDDIKKLEQLIEKADVIAFGPGLGQTEWARQLYALVASSELPSVWDADALNLLATMPEASGARIITPHPGEAGRLLGLSAGAVQADRPAALATLATRYDGVAVLKGAGSLVSSAGDVPWLCTAGNPGMAAPGMGDVLTGIIAALLAQGLAPGDAAAAGVDVHARAGDRAAQAGQRGLLASDLVREIRGIINP